MEVELLFEVSYEEHICNIVHFFASIFLKKIERSRKKHCQEGGGGHFQDQFINGTTHIKKIMLDNEMQDEVSYKI